MSYQPNRRDPLVQRVAHSLREAIDDPWAYGEGPSEPEYLVFEEEPPTLGERVLFWICMIGGPVMLVLIATGSI